MPTGKHTHALVDFSLSGVLTTSQYIYDIRISPNINTVRISFKTVQPTIPVITCTASDGSVSFAFPIFSGKQSEHVGILGEHRPLQQGTNHRLKIVAAGTNRHGQRIEREVIVNFRTGTRDGAVMFDDFFLLRPTRADLQLFFVVGDAETGEVIGNLLEWPFLEIDGTLLAALNLTKTVPTCPRLLWVRAMANMDPGHSEGEEAWDPLHPFQGERHGSSTDGGSTHITRVVGPLADFNSDTTFNLELHTSHAHILNFVVNTRIHIKGAVPPTIALNRKPVPDYMAPPFDLGLVEKPKMVMKSAAEGNQRREGYFVAVGAEGALYFKPIRHPQLTDDREWMRAPGEPKMPVKAFVGGDSRLNLFAYDDKGGVIYLKPDRSGEDASWSRLGRQVSGPLAVAEGRTGDIDVFGLGENDVVFRTQVRPGGERDQDDWERIGEKVRGSLSAFAFADDTVGVFALGLSGDILHKRRRGDEWDPPGLRWHSLGRAKGDKLIVMRLGEDKGVIIATLGEDDFLQYLEWPKYPAGNPDRDWIKIGTIEAWLASHSQRRSGRAVADVRKSAGSSRKRRK